jgi:hypothetical protein
MKSMYFKIFMAIVFSLIFLQSNIVVAGDLSLNNSRAQVLDEAQLRKLIENGTADFSGIGTRDQCNSHPETADSDTPFITTRSVCISNYNNLYESKRQGILNRVSSDMGNAAAADSGNIVKPMHNCHGLSTETNTDYGGNSSHAICMNNFNNSQAMIDYNRQVAARDEVNAQQIAGTSGPETPQQRQIRLDAARPASVTESMETMMQQNRNAETESKSAANQTALISAGAFAAAAACSATAGACAPPFIAVGILNLLLNKKSNQQAYDHCQAQLQACETYNKLSSTQKVCACNYTPITPENVAVDPNTTVQLPITTSAIAGSGSTTTGAGTSGSGPVRIRIDPTCTTGKSCVITPPKGLTQNPLDGSVTMKTAKGSKTYTMADFADKKSMMDMGMTAAQADSLMKSIHGKNGIMENAGLDLKNMGKDSGKNFGGFSDLGGASKNSANANSGNDASSRKFGDKMGEVASSGRGPSSEGLSRDFNGDLIGAAGDDIFSMMKRRYILKNEQDSFIAP